MEAPRGSSAARGGARRRGGALRRGGFTRKRYVRPSPRSDYGDTEADGTQTSVSRPVYEYCSGRPASPELEEKIKLISNCFAMKAPSGRVYHYNVNVYKIGLVDGDKLKSQSTSSGLFRYASSELNIRLKTNREVVQKMLTENPAFSGTYGAYDGKRKLLCRRSLELVENRLTWVVTVPQRQTSQSPECFDVFRVIVTPVIKKNSKDCSINLDTIHAFYAGNIDRPPLEAITALELIFRHGPCLRFTLAGRDFFYPPEEREERSLDGALKIWHGYHQHFKFYMEAPRGSSAARGGARRRGGALRRGGFTRKRYVRPSPRSDYGDTEADGTQTSVSRPVYEYCSGRPASPELEEKIKLISNCFAMKAPSGCVYHYNVNVYKIGLVDGDKLKSQSTSSGIFRYASSELNIRLKTNREVVQKMLTENPAFSGTYGAYDGKQKLLCRRSLEMVENRLSWVVTLPQRETSQSPECFDVFRVIVTPVIKKNSKDCSINLDTIHAFYAGNIDRPPLEAITALELILRHGPCMQFTAVGRDFFYPPQEWE
ncbi:hypothetical protein JTE90_012078, partial [Oedothorax gibbosus]